MELNSPTFFKLPKETVTQVASYLEYDDWSHFRETCKFFNAGALANNRNLVSIDYKVYAGYNHVFVLSKKTGKLYASGENSNGELGLGDTKSRNYFTKVKLPKEIGQIREIKAGDGNTFILSCSGRVYACGQNWNGQLGLGDTKNRSRFTKIAIDKTLHIRQIATGYAHTLLLLSDGTIRGCGSNHDYQLGLKSKTANQYLFIPIPIKNNPPVRAISAGYAHTILWLTNDDVYVCGDNSHGQFGQIEPVDQNTSSIKNFTKLPINQFLSQNDKLQQVLYNKSPCIKQIASDTNHTFIQMNNGKFYRSGKSILKQSGKNFFNFYSYSVVSESIQRFFVGREKTFFLSKEGHLYGFGRNDAGQLGLKHTVDNIGVPEQIFIDGIKQGISVRRIETTAFYTFLLLSNGEWYVSGGNIPQNMRLKVTAKTGNYKTNVFTPCEFKDLLEPEPSQKKTLNKDRRKSTLF